MAGWFGGGGGGGFSGMMGGLGDRLLGHPGGNPYTGNSTGGAYGRGGAGSAFGGYQPGGEGSLSFDNRYLAAHGGGGGQPPRTGVMPMRPQPFGNGQPPGAGMTPMGGGVQLRRGGWAY